MIPKIIHACWFGNPMPSILKDYINSWIFNLWSSGYKLMFWTLDNIGEYSKNELVTFLVNNKLWAFLSDYIRLRVLYDYGGIYLDTDVKVVNSFDKILHLNTYLGFEIVDFNNKNYAIEGCKITTAIMGAVPKNNIFKILYLKMELLDYNKHLQITSNKLLIPPDLLTYYIKLYVPFLIVNSIKEAEEAEAKNLLPLFNRPKFDRYYENSGIFEQLQDYGICDHAFTNLWLK